MPQSLAGIVVCAVMIAAQADENSSLTLRIDAGRFDRVDCVVQAELELKEQSAIWLDERRDGASESSVRPILAQVDRLAEPRETPTRVRLTFILPGTTPAGASRVFSFRTNGNDVDRAKPPWTFTDRPDGSLELANRDRTVFRYNRTIQSHPNYPPILRRDAYIHPAFTPTGALITGDFSRAHPHHRGFFFAYAKTQVGDLKPDFWNIQSGTGKIVFDRLVEKWAGPVTAGFEAEHRWEAKGAGVVLNERWRVEAIDVRGAPYWLFDLTSTQQATDKPVTLPPYRYGGMAYRGPDSFLPLGKVDVLTSEGLGRRDGDQKPARWVDWTGPIADGSKQYAGAMICDHPSNPHHPTPARIHPISLPFFAFTPAHDKALTIGKDAPTVFRYRIVIHDGHPNRDRDERIWRDLAKPVKATVIPEA